MDHLAVDDVSGLRPQWDHQTDATCQRRSMNNRRNRDVNTMQVRVAEGRNFQRAKDSPLFSTEQLGSMRA